MEESLRISITDPNSYKEIVGRCCFGTTAFFSKHRWHIGWESNEDLIANILSSCHIPFYCKHNAGIKGIPVIDGAYGFAGLDLPHGDKTLFIGIDPHAEITRLFTIPEMFFPSIGKALDDMIETGYQAMINWNGKYLKKVGHRKPNYKALYILWFLKFLEIICGYFMFFIFFFVDVIQNIWNILKQLFFQNIISRIGSNE
jgi:hypothetical protein